MTSADRYEEREHTTTAVLVSMGGGARIKVFGSQFDEEPVDNLPRMRLVHYSIPNYDVMTRALTSKFTLKIHQK